MLLYTMLRNAEDYVRCRTSAIPYGYWCMGKEEGSRIEDSKAYQQQHSVALNPEVWAQQNQKPPRSGTQRAQTWSTGLVPPPFNLLWLRISKTHSTVQLGPASPPQHRPALIRKPTSNQKPKSGTQHPRTGTQRPWLYQNHSRFATGV
jgi:hypothetical protein